MLLNGKNNHKNPTNKQKQLTFVSELYIVRRNHPGVTIDVNQNTKVVTKQIKTSFVLVFCDIIVIYNYICRNFYKEQKLKIT